ncbi:DMT family transporter [Mycobacterium marinum]|uniref:DMT family transporter n=1 Tax=Mycobacterium marinum TaxID=1781 RepID=UPI000358A468|nr:DMT family transporter [Mycobacterium marinum]EPQ78585.1 Permease of the drug/metabolite transporter (DMT) superfamily [Mycobacterium marinum MB2]MDC8973108.1 DMT family transporter [Mycobacterium marinum]MDC9005436.1 DMT family transporter [Mycobacterium marinum]
MTSSTTSSQRTVNMPALAMGVTVTLWAFAFVGVRSAGRVFSPGVLALSRLFIAVMVMAVIATIAATYTAYAGRATTRRLRPPSAAALTLVIAYGVAWFGAYSIVISWAEQHIDAGTTALLVNLAPILVAVFAGFFLGEGYSARLLTGIAIAFAGVVLISAGGGGSQTDWLGVGLGLLAAVLYAAGVLLQKVALRTVDALSATLWGTLVGFIVTLPFLPAAARELSLASAADLWWLVFLGAGPSAIAFTTWAYALARTNAGVTAATTLMVPALVIALSGLLLAEVPNSLGLAGGGACLIGVALARGLLRLPARSRRRTGTGDQLQGVESLPVGLSDYAASSTAPSGRQL